MARHSKSLLSRLMAEENIEVIEGNFKTASFDVSNRVLRIPIFKETVTEDISTLMISHEIGHALYTPEDGWHDSTTTFPEIPRALINIVEDVRIERLIKDRFPGAVYYFVRGYSELLERDFFGVKDIDDLNELGFLNKFNLRAKCGELVNIDFEGKEKDLFEEAFENDTFEEVLDLCQKIVDYLKQKQEEKQPEPEQDEPQDGENEQEESDDNQNQSEAGGGSEDEQDEPQDESESSEEDQSDSESTEEQMDNQESSDDQSEASDDFEAQYENGEDGRSKSEQEGDTEVDDSAASGSDEASDDESKAYKESSDAEEQVELSEEELDKIVLEWDNDQESDTSLSTDHSQREKEQQEIFENNHVTIIKFNEFLKVVKTGPSYSSLKDRYSDFLRDNRDAVEFLSSQFRQRKAAHAKAMSKKKMSGQLDGKRLHSYKTSSSIFKKKVIRPKQKNHGVVMLLDTSGSMSGERVRASLKQILIMTEFCHKNKIPFEVLKFNPNDEDSWTSKEDGKITKMPKCPVLISSTEGTAAYKNKAGKLYDFVTTGGYDIDYNRPRANITSGTTPYQSNLLSTATRCIQFKNESGVEKLHLIVLTDGVADNVRNVKKVIFSSDSVRPVHYDTTGGRHTSLIYYTLKFLRDAVVDSVSLYALGASPSIVLTGTSRAGRPSANLDVQKDVDGIDVVVSIPSRMLTEFIVGGTPEAKKRQKLICKTLIDRIV